MLQQKFEKPIKLHFSKSEITSIKMGNNACGGGSNACGSPTDKDKP